MGLNAADAEIDGVERRRGGDEEAIASWPTKGEIGNALRDIEAPE